MSAPGTWSKGEAAAFSLVLSLLPTGRLGRVGVDYPVVADMCEALGRPRPSQLGEERRHLLVAWLLTTPGRAALSHAASGRARLLETAREYPRKTLQMAALSAGLVDPKSGKPRSAPASLSARELWLLIGAIPLPGRVEESSARSRCEDCGRSIFGTCERCPSCGSVLLDRVAA